MSRMLIQVLPNRSPIPAPMYRAQAPSRSDIHPFPVPEARFRLLQRRIAMAEHDKAHVPQAVLYMLGHMRAIRHEADPEDIQAMDLVDHRDGEGPVVGAEVGEAVGVWVLRVPLVVCVEGEVGGGEVEGHPRGRDFQRKLSGIVGTDVGYAMGTVS